MNVNNLTERLYRAIDRLAAIASEPLLSEYEVIRLSGKIEGVKLALSYIEEERNDRS